jgi:hypothetical protein
MMANEPTFSDRFYALEKALRERAGEKPKPPDETSWKRMSIGAPSSLIGPNKSAPAREPHQSVAAEVPLSSPPGLRWIDAMLDQADAKDRMQRVIDAAINSKIKP